jgi:hypothetical protein
MSEPLTLEMLRRSWRSWTASNPRTEGPPWLQLVWTALFCLPCALLFTIMGMVFNARGGEWAELSTWWQWFKLNLFVSLFIGYTIHGLFELVFRFIGVERIERLSDGRRALLFVAVPLVGVAIGWPLSVSLLRGGIRGSWNGGPNLNVGFLLFAFMFSLLMYLYFGGKARVEQANRRAAEAQLRLLQGQIEPHFLFNTLANVIGLIDADPARARLMLESFIDYLRSSLGGLRNQAHTLGQELALVDAYLRVLSLRMEDRLRVRLDVPSALHTVQLPAVLVQPLVENAIHHGLEPKVEGGEVHVRALVEGTHLRIDVIDDGLGLNPASPPGRRGGAGAALANIRERLRAAYGSSAQLQIENRPEGGVRASLLLPWPLPTV